MAKIQRVEKCRKEQKCSKCGCTIEKGNPYLYAEPMYRPKIIRCASCGLQSWETSGSDFVLTCGAIQYNWREDYKIDQSTVESIKSDLEDLRDTCQDSLDNMPESLQYGATGEMLQDRIDMLEDVINELDSVTDYETARDDLFEEVEDDFRKENEIDDGRELSDIEKSDFLDLLEARTESNLADEIDEALLGLCFE